MNRTTFYTMIGLSLLFAGIHLFEALLYDSCQEAQVKQAATREQMVRAREMHDFDMQLLKRLVVESQTDSEIAGLLKRHGINVVATPLAPRSMSPASALPTPSGRPATPPTPTSL